MRCCNDAYRLYSFHRYLRLRRRSRCPLRGIHAGLSHALPLLPQSGYMVLPKGLSLPDASTRTSGASALSEGVSCPSKHTSRRKSSRKHFFARHSATGVTGAGAAASPSAAENRSFKLTFCVNFSSLPKNSTFTPHWTPRDSHLPPPNLSFPA